MKIPKWQEAPESLWHAAGEGWEIDQTLTMEGGARFFKVTVRAERFVQCLRAAGEITDERAAGILGITVQEARARGVLPPLRAARQEALGL